MQGLGASILIPLSFLGDPAAKRHKEPSAALEAAETAAAAVAEATGGLSAPLLPPEGQRRHSMHRAPPDRSDYARTFSF